MCGRTLQCYPVRQSFISLFPFDNKKSEWTNVPFTLCSSAFCSLSPSLKKTKLSEPLIVCWIPESGMHFCQPISIWMEVQSCCSSHKSTRGPVHPSGSSHAGGELWLRIGVHTDISAISPVSSLSTLFHPPL